MGTLETTKKPDVNTQYIADRAKLLNQLGRRPSSQWSEADTAWLVDLLEQEPVDPSAWTEGGDLPEEEREEANRNVEHYTMQLSAMLVVATHLSINASLPQRVIDSFESRVMANLVHWHDSHRRAAIACIKEAGWLGRADIRPLIEDLRDNDPDESIRNQARRFLLFHDGMPVDNPDDCPTCPSKTDLSRGG